MEENEFGNIKIHNGLDTKFATGCIICNKLVPISEREACGVCIKVCQECKYAIEYAKMLKDSQSNT